MNHDAQHIYNLRAEIMQQENEMHRLVAQRDALLEALRMWLHLHEAPAGYEGKYGKALDAAIAAQQVKIDAAANAARAAIKNAEGGQ